MRTKQILFLIFLLALLLRVGFIIFYDHGKMLKNQLYAADETSYDQVAVNLLNGKGFVTGDGLYARRGPIYPLFLAVIYCFWGHSYVAVRFIQSVIEAFTCIIVYLVAKELLGNKTGLASAFICALYYPFIQQSAYILTEVLFNLLLTMSLYFLLRYYNKRKILSALFPASLIFGLASLCRESVLYFPLGIFLWLVHINRNKIRIGLTGVAIFMLGICLSVGPWTLRNYSIYKAFIPLTVSGGHALYYGNNSKATGGTLGWNRLEKDSFLPQDLGYPVYSLEADRKLFKLASGYIKQHPARFFLLGIRKTINMWRPFYADAHLLNKIVMGFQQIPLMLFAVLGILVNLTKNRKNEGLWLVYFLILYYIAIHAVTIGEIRYRYPIMPYLIIFSAIGINHLLESKKQDVQSL